MHVCVHRFVPAANTPLAEHAAQLEGRPYIKAIGQHIATGNMRAATFLVALPSFLEGDGIHAIAGCGAGMAPGEALVQAAMPALLAAYTGLPVEAVQVWRNGTTVASNAQERSSIVPGILTMMTGVSERSLPQQLSSDNLLSCTSCLLHALCTPLTVVCWRAMALGTGAGAKAAWEVMEAFSMLKPGDDKMRDAMMPSEHLLPLLFGEHAAETLGAHMAARSLRWYCCTVQQYQPVMYCCTVPELRYRLSCTAVLLLHQADGGTVWGQKLPCTAALLSCRHTTEPDSLLYLHHQLQGTIPLTPMPITWCFALLYCTAGMQQRAATT